MARIIEPDWHLSLDDYGGVAQLASAVNELRLEAARLVPQLEGRTVWMVNSTEQGGGVAEMLPTQIALLRELGLDVRWAVIEADDPRFFTLTKRIHNLIHGEGEPRLSPEDREVYDAVSHANAEALARHIDRDAILIVHDPQPLGAGALLKERFGMPAIWRCHIGLDEHLPQTRAAWGFLKPYACRYDRAVFSAPEYIPDFLAGYAAIIHPALDPLSHKNRELPIHKLVGILCNAGLIEPHAPPITPAFPEPAQRLQPDGDWAEATRPEDFGLLFRPIVTEVSRWDRLKGFLPLLRAFVELKRGVPERHDLEHRHRRTLENVRLVLAGPDPASVQDDPEAGEVLEEIRELYLSLEPELQRDVVIISLPMGSRKYNALMVNALQRCSSIIVQNSLREGFGLTATEGMWKAKAVLGTRAVGLRQQIRDGLDGRLVSDAEDADELARTLDEMLADEHGRDLWGMTAQHRAYHEFLVFPQLRRWLELLSDTVRAANGMAPSQPSQPSRPAPMPTSLLSEET
jgi:trehalose synthase